MFCDISAGAQAASADVPTATEEDTSARQAKRSVIETILAGDTLPWRIPESVERGYEISICLTSAHAIPEFGKFPRLGMDVIVNVVWLADYWAKAEDDSQVVSALESLSLDGSWTSC